MPASDLFGGSWGGTRKAGTPSLLTERGRKEGGKSLWARREGRTGCSGARHDPILETSPAGRLDPVVGAPTRTNKQPPSAFTLRVPAHLAINTRRSRAVAEKWERVFLELGHLFQPRPPCTLQCSPGSPAPAAFSVRKQPEYKETSCKKHSPDPPWPVAQPQSHPSIYPYTTFSAHYTQSPHPAARFPHLQHS